MGRIETRFDGAAPAFACRECGEGETVLLLHGAVGSAADWRPVMHALQPLYRVVVAGQNGDGAWVPSPAGATFRLRDEIRTRELRSSCPGEFHLVGHSDGALAALALALDDPARIISLTLVEPVVRDRAFAGDCLAPVATGSRARRFSVLAERTLLVRGELAPEPVCFQVDALHALVPGSALTIVPAGAQLSPRTDPAALVAALMQHLHAAFERRMR